jgi:ribosomal protein S18 acetylase RimI-like enzyme
MKRSGPSSCCSAGSPALSRSAIGSSAALVVVASLRAQSAFLLVGRSRTRAFARVEALVEPENTPSQRVLEGVGFQREGHLRSYLVFDGRRADAFIYSQLASDLG